MVLVDQIGCGSAPPSLAYQSPGRRTTARYWAASQRIAMGRWDLRRGGEGGGWQSAAGTTCSLAVTWEDNAEWQGRYRVRTVLGGLPWQRSHNT